MFGKVSADLTSGPDALGRAVWERPVVVSGRGVSRALASAVVSVFWFAVRSAGPSHHHALIESVRRASGVVGPGPVLSMVEVSTLEDVVGRRCQEAARGGDPRPLHEVAMHRAAEVPATERQRRTRIDRRSPRAIAGGAPSLAELCAATTKPRTGPRVEIPDEAWVAIAQEVGPMLEGVDDLTRQQLARASDL